MSKMEANPAKGFLLENVLVTKIYAHVLKEGANLFSRYVGFLQFINLWSIIVWKMRGGGWSKKKFQKIVQKIGDVFTSYLTYDSTIGRHIYSYNERFNISSRK